MKVILLAAGRSQRVQPIPDKNFLRFCGKFLIEHQLEALHAEGFIDFLVVGGEHNLERLKAFTTEWAEKKEGVKIQVKQQDDLRQGMAGAVLSVRSAINPGEPLLIISSNDVVEPHAYRSIVSASQKTLGESFLLAKQVGEYFPGGYLQVDDVGRIQQIIEKPGEGNEPSDLVNVVVHLHQSSAKLYEFLDKTETTRDDRYEVALDQMIQSGIRMNAVPYDGYWQPIKYPWHVLDVSAHYLQAMEPFISPEATIEEGARLKGKVMIEAGAKLFAGATVVGPAYIGKNSIVATQALVRDASLGENCVIGFNTEVARSVLGDEVWTHSNYIGDSVIGNNVSFGAGAITGNLRFDEAAIPMRIQDEKVNSGKDKLGLITGNDIRIGINTSFMPGVKIGSGSLVGAGITVDRDIPEKSFASGEITLKIVPNRGCALPSRDRFREALPPVQG